MVQDLFFALGISKTCASNISFLDRMPIVSEDRTTLVEAKLVQKRTFLHLEPQHDNGRTSHGLLKRTMSDTFVDYSFETESDAVSTTMDSPRSMLSEDFSSGSTKEEFSGSSQASDTDEMVAEERFQAPATASDATYLPCTQTALQVLPQHGQICFCYVAVATPQDSAPALDCTHAMSEALKYKAQAA